MNNPNDTSMWESLLDIFTSKEDRIQQQISQLQNTIIQDKSNHNYESAAKTYHIIADKYLEINETSDAITNFTIAGEYYERCNKIDAAIKSYTTCGDLYLKRNNIKKTADFIVRIAKLYESIDLNKAIDNYLKAIHYYELCADFYGQKTQLEKITQLYLDNEKFEEALKTMYDTLIILNKHNEKYTIMQKYMKTTLYFNILVCALTLDIVLFKKTIAKYATDDYFPQTLEYKFLNNLFNTYESHDYDDFNYTISKYKQLKKIQPWHDKCFSKLLQEIEIKDDDLC